MSKYVVVVFPDEAKADEGSRAFKQLHGEGSLTLYGIAVVAEGADGTVSIKEAADEGPVGTAVGMLVGSLVGILGGPAGAALGGAGGALIGSVGDLANAGVGVDFLDVVGSKLERGTVAVAAEVDEYRAAPVDTRMEALGGTVFHRPRAAFEDDLFRQEVNAWNAEMAELRAEMTQLSADAKAKVQARIDGARANLKAAAGKADKKIKELRSEADAKIEQLEEQAKRITGEVKAKIEKQGRGASRLRRPPRQAQ